MEERTDSHRASGRVLEVYEYLARSGETTTLAALSSRMGVPKSSLLPLLRTLVARKWLEQPLPATYKVAWTPAFGVPWAVHQPPRRRCAPSDMTKGGARGSSAHACSTPAATAG